MLVHSERVQLASPFREGSVCCSVQRPSGPTSEYCAFFMQGGVAYHTRLSMPMARKEGLAEARVRQNQRS